MSESVKRVLLVGVENFNRSQIVEAYSAGSDPPGVINPTAIAAMGELGYDLAAHGSKSLDDLPNVEFDFMATMGCGDKCLFIWACKRTDWALPDPKHMGPEEYRGVRDEIRERVRVMLKEFGVAVPER